MKIEVKHQIVEAAKAYMAEHGLSQNEMAKKSSVNSGYLSQMLKPESDFTYQAGDKKGQIADTHFFNLAQFIGLSLEKTYWEVKQTGQLLATLANLKDAKAVGSAGVIIGETGSGKTFGANLFANKNPQDCFIVTIGSSDNLGDIIDKIIDALKIVASAKTKSAKLREIAKALKNLKAQGFTPQIIFDECEYMKQVALCMMKELYDSLFTFCSLIMIGTDQLTQNLERLRKRNKAGIPQFYRRIKFGIRQLPPIDKSFSLFVDNLPKPVVRFLQMNCDNYGELHDAMVTAMREADRMEQPVSIDLIKRVLNLPDAA
jgi:DNA transposition AAA+ family ATPase